MSINEYDYSLDGSFGSTIMYFYSFDETIEKKNLQILTKLIETHHDIYKLIFEVIYQNNRYKIDYDNEKSSDLIKNNNCIVSKLFVIKRSETKNKMFYYEINDNLMAYFEKNKSQTSILVDLNASLIPYNEYDLNKEKLLLSNLIKNKIKLNNIQINKKNGSIFLSDEFIINSNEAKNGKIVCNSLFINTKEEFIKEKLSELMESASDSNLLLLQNLLKNINKLNNLWFEYEIKYLFC